MNSLFYHARKQQTWSRYRRIMQIRANAAQPYDLIRTIIDYPMPSQRHAAIRCACKRALRANPDFAYYVFFDDGEIA